MARLVHVVRGERVLLDSDLADLYGVEARARKHRGRAYRPYAFTEQGVAMLSSVLRSPRAVEVKRGIGFVT